MNTIISDNVVDICTTKVQHNLLITWYVKKIDISYKLIARMFKLTNKTLTMGEEMKIILPHYPINIAVHPVNERQFIMAYRNFKEEPDPNKNNRFYTYVALLTQVSEDKIVAMDPLLLKNNEGFNFRIEDTGNGEFAVYFNIQKTYTREKYRAHLELKRDVLHVKNVELIEEV